MSTPLNILLLTNADIASVVAANALLPQLSDHQVHLRYSSSVGKSQPTNDDLRMLKFVEQSLFFELLFPALKQGGGALKAFDHLHQYLADEPQQFNNINSDEGHRILGELQPDIILSIRYGKILKDPVIAIPKYGVINLHSGLLPQYQGVMATFRALANGDEHIGTTLHYISDSGIDTGSIITLNQIPVSREHSYLWHVIRLYESGCKSMAEAVTTLAKGSKLPAKDQRGEAQYFTFPDEGELQQFKSRGWCLFDPQDIVDLGRLFIGD